MNERRDLFHAGLDFETLEENASSSSASLRWAAAIEFGEIGDEASAALLWTMRSDQDENVRKAVESALARFDRTVLERALNSHDVARVPETGNDEHDYEDGLAPFTPWKVRPLEEPSAENEWAVASAINDIVSTEGPMTGHRLMRLYGQAVYPNAPKKLSKYRMKSALRSLMERGILGRCDTSTSEEIETWTIYRLDGPEVFVRKKGPRAYDEIPLNEVRELIRMKAGFAKNLTADRTFRIVMDAYEIQQRDLHILGALFEKEWAGLLA